MSEELRAEIREILYKARGDEKFYPFTETIKKLLAIVEREVVNVETETVKRYEKFLADDFSSGRAEAYKEGLADGEKK